MLCVRTFRRPNGRVSFVNHLPSAWGETRNRKIQDEAFLKHPNFRPVGDLQQVVKIETLLSLLEFRASGKIGTLVALSHPHTTRKQMTESEIAQVH
jgi:hypothetical protein